MTADRKRWNDLGWVLIGLLLAGALAIAFYSVALKADSAPAQNDGSPSAEFARSPGQRGQVAPSTEAERELARMLRGHGESLELALANWLMVADIHAQGGADEVRSRRDLAWAHLLAPEDPAIAAAYAAILRGGKHQPEHGFGENSPGE